MGILSNWPNHHPKKRANFWLRTACSSTKDFPSSKLTSKTFKNRVLASNSEHHLGHSKASRNWHSHLSHGCSTLRPASIFLYKRAPWNPYFLWGELCHSPPGHDSRWVSTAEARASAMDEVMAQNVTVPVAASETPPQDLMETQTILKNTWKLI